MAHSFRVLIIGAGICGLAAAASIALQGHQVFVFESAPRLHLVGAGIQITPNGVRVLRRLGIAADLEKKATVPETLTILRYDGRKILGHRECYHEELERKYAEPIWCLHRVDLQEALAARSKALGVHLHFDAHVSAVDYSNSTVLLTNGRMERGDLIIAADGLWSTARSSLLGKTASPQPTNDLAYRITLTADEIGRDEEVQNLIRHPGIRIWMGPGAHAVAYSLRSGQMINIVLLVPDNLPDGSARAAGCIDEMMKLFQGWDPLLNRCLSHVRKVDKWRLMHLKVDEPWISEAGTFVMAGDACHPMLPYLAQGANLALEDGAALGVLLSDLHSASEIPKVLKIYQTLRKNRASVVRNETLRHQIEFHLPDGQCQEARDRELSESFTVNDDDCWTHPKIQRWLFGYDVYKETRDAKAA